jgi:hypothetical protein
MSTWKIVQFSAGLLLVLLVAVFALGCLTNADAITQVRMRLLDGKQEPSDHHLLGIGDEDRLPDYSLRIRAGNQWNQVGTRLNTSAKQWLSFPLAEGIPVRRAFEVQVVEDDKLENDILEQLPISGTQFAGDMFEFDISTERSTKVGMEWFFDTPVGKAISVGITIAVICLLLAAFGPLVS